ncbi:citramalate synthase [Zongyangia hominis]|uniref:Citramalate synthase n=1 Tax=Zongyangia hominis TaxID=2763677 RepID=A0A926ECQ8_9FIRM|nr:citramalate synthase [Zongyangia hominis]MBC8569829.1 citramalate synthase [Zongyangia hominis]
MKKIEIFDSTLRDGAQGEGISFSVEDKLNIARALDQLGVDYIEAGNPGSNPKDMEFFERSKRQGFRYARLVAFGSTRRCGIKVEEDKNVRALVSAGTSTVAIFGKCWDMHVTDILKTSLEENIGMIEETLSYFKAHGKEVIFDAEHFFDGYKHNPAYAMQALEAAVRAGADCLTLCDTNGGCFPVEIYEITQTVCARFPQKVGIHCHNDMGCAVAGSLMAVKAGASHVQGTYIGFGERCGNTNLSSLIPSLQLKVGYRCIPEENVRLLTKTANYIAEIANLTVDHGMPYVGKSAFAHKGGMHVDGVNKNSASFEHIAPERVGNKRNILLSEVAGRGAVIKKLSHLDRTITKDSPAAQEIVDLLKTMEYEGYEFESASASLELLVLKRRGKFTPFFHIEHFKIIGEREQEMSAPSSAMVKIKVGDRYEITADEGNGPVHALDKAMRKALEVFYPALSHMRLIDYKVRVMETHQATAAKVRVLIESTDGQNVWSTVGVSTDVINASATALTDSIEYKLYRDANPDR